MAITKRLKRTTTLKRVNEYVTKNKCSAMQACKKLGLNPGSYYNARHYTKALAKKRRIKTVQELKPIVKNSWILPPTIGAVMQDNTLSPQQRLDVFNTFWKM